MVRAAERHGELIAYASTNGGGLRKPEVMGIRRSPFAKETRLRGHELKMRAIAVAARLVQRKLALVDGRLGSCSGVRDRFRRLWQMIRDAVG